MRVDPAPLLRTAAALLLASVPTLLHAQAGKDMGQAGQFYNPGKPKFHFTPGIKDKRGNVTVHTAPGGRQEFVPGEYAILEKDVVIQYEDITIHADKLTANLKTNDVVAEGHVIVDQGPTRLTGDHIVFNLDSKTGTFFNATGALQPDMYFVGDKIERLSEDRYRLTNGMFTSCAIDRPSWSFHLAEADVTLDDYAHMKDVSFRAHDVPLLFTPRLVWPTKHDRSQGFLIPRIMYVSTVGDDRNDPTKTQKHMGLQLGYFIPIGDSFDATIYADVNTKDYNGAGVNLRYRPSENIKLGDLSAYMIHDPANGREEWKYAYQHSQDNLPGGFRGVVDVQDFSNVEFFRRFSGSDPRLHTLSQIYSSAYLTKNRPTYSFNILTDRRDILLSNVNPNDPFAAPPRQRFEQMPSLQFRLYPNRIGETPLYYSLESSLSHLVTSGLTNGPNANYYRGDFFPTLSLQLRTPSWFSVRPQISLRETYYSDSLTSGATTTFPLTTSGEALHRFYAQGQVEVVGPSLSKIYNRSAGGFSRFKHVIEPRVRYLYTTGVNEQERVIRFDTVDSPFLPIVRNSVEYSLTQRLIGRETGANGNSREVASFSLSQSVSLGNPFTNATGGSSLFGTSFTQQGKFTPLVASLHVNPYQSITFDANAIFGNVSHQLDQTSVSANLVGTGVNADKYLSFTYLASFRQPPVNGISFDSSSSSIRLNAGSSLLHDRIRADAQLNFDAKNRKFLEQRYLLGGNASCYGLAFEFRRFLVYVPVEKIDWSAGISISLKNVGAIGTH